MNNTVRYENALLTTFVRSHTAAQSEVMVGDKLTMQFGIT
jgi:hypothetical protein